MRVLVCVSRRVRAAEPEVCPVFYIYRYARFERIKQLAEKNQ